jgi:hypothetical protein
MLPEDEKLANDLNIKDYNPDTPVLEIDPKLMFNEEKLTRTVVIDGKEYEDVISVNYSGKDYYLWSLAYEYKKYGRQLYSKWASNFEEYIEFRLKDGYGKGVGESYPYHEIVSINGVPWQKTIYKDILLKGIKKGSENANPGGLKDKEELWDMLKDPRYNGFAAEIASGEITKEEALKKAMEYGNETVKKSEIKKENAVTETEVKNKPLIIENGAVLKIGSSIVQFYENSTKTENITMRVSPKVVQGHTVIPLRGVFDHFGAKLSYNGKTEEVTIEINNKEIVLKIGSNKAIVNGKEIKMDTKAIVENGRTLIPLRFVGEKLGYKIEWIGSEQKIIIHK